MKNSKRMFLVKAAGIDGYWMTKTGGDKTSDSTKVYDGGSLQPDVLTGPATASNVTISRGWDRARDLPLAVALRSQIGKFTTTLSVQATDADLNATNDPSEQYPGAVLVGLTEPEVDASSGDPAMLQLEWAVPNWK